MVEAESLSSNRNNQNMNAARTLPLPIALTLMLLSHPATAQHPDESDLRANRGPVVESISADKSGVLLDKIAFTPGGGLTATLVNRTNTILRDVRVLIRYDWIWENERHPGDDSPGRSSYFKLTRDVPALATVPIAYVPSPPLPSRSDGRFVPSVEISRYTQVRFKEVRKKLKR